MEVPARARGYAGAVSGDARIELRPRNFSVMGWVALSLVSYASPLLYGFGL